MWKFSDVGFGGWPSGVSDTAGISVGHLAKEGSHESS